MQHRKFARLARLVGSRPLARGHLEMLWDAAYQSGDDLLGDAGDVEHISEWVGEEGKLSRALIESGFLDDSPEGLRVHDLWHHAPEYVAKRAAREVERVEHGETISSLRAKAGRKGAQSRWQTDGKRPPLASEPDGKRMASGVSPSPSPSPSPSQEKQLPPSTNVAEPGAEAPPAGAGATVHPIRKRATPKPVDPRHHPLQLALEAAFKAARGSDYGFQKRDARALTGILALSHGDQAEAVRRFVLGLGSDFKLRCDTIWDLEQKWNSLTTNGATSAVQPSRPVLS